ncbi:MAG: hypothetical protein WCE32_24120, partial [Pseudolabrys sp.]
MKDVIVPLACPPKGAIFFWRLRNDTLAPHERLGLPSIKMQFLLRRNGLARDGSNFLSDPPTPFVEWPDTNVDGKCRFPSGFIRRCLSRWLECADQGGARS